MFTVDDLDPKSFLKAVNFMLASVLRVKSKQSGQVPGTPPQDVDLANYIIFLKCYNRYHIKNKVSNT